jgi:LysM repeat protein
MKILKFSGIVVGIHLFALILIFANPGCSSSTKTPPAPADTATASDAAAISVPGISPAPATDYSTTNSSSSDMPVITGINAAPRYSPTRPGSPVAANVQTEPAPQFTPATTYSVVSGDNLTVVAKKHHLTIAELAAANNLKPTAKLQLGQKLIIPGKTSAPTAGTSTVSASASSVSSSGTAAAKMPEATSPKAAPAESVKHVVRSGETLGGIARKYGVRQGDIAVANSISDPAKIRPGQELIIPGWQAPSAKAAKSSTEAAAPKPGLDPQPYVPSPAVSSSSTSATPPPAEVPVIKIEDTPPAK